MMILKSVSTLPSTVETIDLCAHKIYNDLLDFVLLGIAFEVHRSAKKGYFEFLPQFHIADVLPSVSSNGITPVSASTDVFGNSIIPPVGVPTLKKQLECVCPNCTRSLAASRFAPHLEKCMGMGRNSSRLASRRLASNSKENSSYREGNFEVGEDDAEDEDWIEPGKVCGNGMNRKKPRDKHSPRRTKMLNRNGLDRDVSNDVCLPHGKSYEEMDLPTRINLLASICGVMSVNSGKICTRSTRCHVHTDVQRRQLRSKLISNSAVSVTKPIQRAAVPPIVIHLVRNDKMNTVGSTSQSNACDDDDSSLIQRSHSDSNFNRFSASGAGSMKSGSMVVQYSGKKEKTSNQQRKNASSTNKRIASNSGIKGYAPSSFSND